MHLTDSVIDRFMIKSVVYNEYSVDDKLVVGCHILLENGFMTSGLAIIPPGLLVKGGDNLLGPNQHTGSEAGRRIAYRQAFHAMFDELICQLPEQGVQ